MVCSSTAEQQRVQLSTCSRTMQGHTPIIHPLTPLATQLYSPRGVLLHLHWIMYPRAL